jgi:hypothetical protein
VSSPFGFFMQGFPDPEKAKRIQMEQENLHNLFRSYLKELDVQHLQLLHYLFSNTANEPKMGAYYEGMISALLIFTKDVCPVHGVNHAEEDLRNLTEGDEDAGSS